MVIKNAKMLSFLIALVWGFSAQAQYYSTGQEAASVRWRQIKTDKIKLIYPDFYEKNARWLASYLDTVAVYGSITLNNKPGRIPLIMHALSTTSNAVVAWAPKRMEFYTTPPQDMYAQPWLEQLSLHEYRHVVQIDKLNQGPTKVISWLFGQQGTAAILGLYVPPWFLEGDAVATETGLSMSGRGRVPQFEMRLRAQLIEEGPYSYDKAVLGSYRDFVPNSYELGYHLITEGRRLYGPELWEHTLDMVARRPYMITPFQKGIRDISGKRKIPFYQECMLNLRQHWEMQDKVSERNILVDIDSYRKHYTNYRHPAYMEDGSIFAMRTGMDDITRFVVFDNDGREKLVHTPGFMKEESLSYAAMNICWIESRPDPRWAHRAYTDIKIFNLKTGKKRSLKYKQRLLAPTFSADARRIVAVGIDSLDNYSLVLINAADGFIQKKIPAPENAYPLTPSWAGDEAIITVLVSENGKALVRINVETGEVEDLIPWSYTELSQAVFQDPFIYFVSSWSGISNIYSLNLDTKEIRLITGSQFGALDPHISKDGASLLYADYRSKGFQLMQWPASDGIPISKVFDKSIGLYRVLEDQEKVVPSGSQFAPSDAPSKKYSKAGNLFNFHSWAPLDVDASNYTINPGVSIMSQNLLSSSFLSAGYSYNVNEELGKIYARYTYAGWYPMIDLSVDYGLRREYAYLPELTEVKWYETNLKAGLRLPLNFRRGKYYAGMQGYAYANEILRRIKSPEIARFKKADIFSLDYGLSAYRQLKTSHRDIYPRWGQSLGMYYRHTPFEGDNNSSIAAAVLNLYLPGIIRHHGLNIYSGYQQRESGYYKYSDIVAYPRGISDLQHDELLSFRGTYAFPIAYPDWSIGPIVYLKRIRANLFYDYSVGRIHGTDQYYSSTGADLLFETHLLRFFAPIEMGVRGIYLPDENTVEWQFLISIGFESFYVGNGM